jgi:acetolactate synthase small subunit
MKNEMRLWLAVLTTRDHAGDTAAIASVFSGRGIQIDSFIGFGGNPQVGGESEGRIMITFTAFEERSRTLCRVLESLEAVAEVRCFAETDIPAELMLQALAVKLLLAEMKG